MAIKLKANWAQEDEVEKKLHEAFPGSTVRISHRGSLIWGTVHWDGFSGKDQDVRKNLIKKHLFEPLGLRHANILYIIGLAPNEMLEGPRIVTSAHPSDPQND